MTGRIASPALLVVLLASPLPAFAAYDSCFDSGIGCAGLGAPPVVYSVPDSTSRPDAAGSDSVYEGPSDYRDVAEQRGPAEEKAYEEKKQIRAWRRAREKEADEELETLIDGHETEIARLKHAVKTWQTVQKKLPAGKDVQVDLDAWVEESHEAQSKAIEASVALATGAYAEKAFRAGKLVQRTARTAQKLEKELRDIDNEAYALAKKCGSNEKLSKALLDVRAAVAQMREQMFKANLAEIDAIAKKNFYEAMERVIKLCEYAPDERSRLDINLLLAKINAVTFEHLQDAVLDEAIDQAMRTTPEDWTIYLRGVKFLAEYGAAASRFGVAWYQIEEINDQMKDKNALIKVVDERMKSDLARKKNLESELAILKSAKGRKLREKERVLAAFHEFGRERAKSINNWVLKRADE